jgi:hypothetical protein
MMKGYFRNLPFVKMSRQEAQRLMRDWRHHVTGPIVVGVGAESSSWFRTAHDRADVVTAISVMVSLLRVEHANC